MALTPNEFQLKLEASYEKVVLDLQAILETASLAAKALLVKRIIAEGFGRKYTYKPYIKYRIKKNRQTEFVDLSLTGQMYIGWNVPESKREGDIITAGVKGGDNATAMKLMANKKRYPEFDHLHVIDKEIIIETYLRPKIKDLIEKSLLQ